MKLLITGCPRSGTRFVSSILGQSGIRAFHERMGRDGTVSCYFAVDDWYYAGPHSTTERRSAYEWTHIFHQVRHPLNCIASMAALDRPRFWHWTQRHIGFDMEREGRLRYCTRFWLEWNTRVDALEPHWRFQIESDFWPEMCDRLGIAPGPRPVAGSNSIPHSSIGWDDLGELAEPVKLRAKSYGYSV